MVEQIDRDGVLDEYIDLRYFQDPTATSEVPMDVDPGKPPLILCVCGFGLISVVVHYSPVAIFSPCLVQQHATTPVVSKLH